MAVGIKVDIQGDTKGLESALGSAGSSVGGFGGAISALAGPVGIAAAGIGTAAVAIGAMTSAAAGAAHGDYQKVLDDTIAKGQDLAFSDSEVRAGMQALVASTGDVTDASTLLATAQDVARFANVDLETASKAVAKANAGQTGALQKLIPGLQKGKTATDTIANASKLAAGQADAYSKSSAGMQKAGADAFGEIGETIGSAFLPVLDEVLPALLPVVKQLAGLVSQILPLIIPLVKLLAKALGVVASVLGIVVGWLVKLVTWLANAARKVGEFLDKINPLKGFKLPSLPFLSSAPPAGASGRGRAAGGSTAAPGGIVINVSGALEPEATARAILRVLGQHGRRVGQLGPLTSGPAI
jgi:hypothetical protein